MRAISKLIGATMIAAGLLAGASTPALANAGSCDEACLLKLADRTMAAIAKQDFRSLPWADPTKYTENNVSLMIGDAWWGSAGETVGTKGFALADTTSGNVVWFGTIWDHDEPSFGAIRLHAPDGKIEAIEVIAGRKPWPMPFGDPRAFKLSAAGDKAASQRDRRSRERLIDIADGYLGTKQRNNGTLLAEFAPGCTMTENGVHITSAEAEYEPRAKDCASVFKEGLFAPVDRIRDRRFPVVDTARGLVLAISTQDVPMRETSFVTTGGTKVAMKRAFPMSRLVAELIRIEGDKVVRSEAVATFLPYRAPTPWKDSAKP
jgi:hypothetical protein